MRDDNNLHCLSFNLFEEKKFSFIRPVVHAKFLGYAYAYFCNPGQYYIGTTANNQGVIKKYKNTYSLKIMLHKLIATYIFMWSPYFTWTCSIYFYLWMYWKNPILPEAGGVNNLHLKDLLLSLFHLFLAICPYRKSSEDLLFLMEQ